MLLIKCFGISLLMMIGASAAFAVESELPLSPLFENCEKVNHTQWINKYNELELKVVEALEENSKNFLIKNIDFY